MTNAPNLTNAQIADRFDEVADLLAAQGADRYRVAAYHHGAQTLRGLAEPVGELFAREGVEGLMALPAVGRTLAQAIVTILRTGELPQLLRLRGDVDVEQVLMTVPGIGPTFAARLHDALHITSLEGLEIAAHDGRLEGLAGFGPRRVAAVRAALAARLGYVRGRVPGGVEPPVEHLLDVDREYRRRAAIGDLPTVAPRRMNPTGEAWLPVLHTVRDGRAYTAMFSNTPRAHRLGRTGDWVVIYPDDPGTPQPYTVVTEWRGANKGQRVVRRRETVQAAGKDSPDR